MGCCSHTFLQQEKGGEDIDTSINWGLFRARKAGKVDLGRQLCTCSTTFYSLILFWFDMTKQIRLWCISTKSLSMGSLQHTIPNLLLPLAAEKQDLCGGALGSSRRREEPAAALAVCAAYLLSPTMQIKIQSFSSCTIPCHAPCPLGEFYSPFPNCLTL